MLSQWNQRKTLGVWTAARERKPPSWAQREEQQELPHFFRETLATPQTTLSLQTAKTAKIWKEQALTQTEEQVSWQILQVVWILMALQVVVVVVVPLQVDVAQPALQTEAGPLNRTTISPC